VGDEIQVGQLSVIPDIVSTKKDSRVVAVATGGVAKANAIRVAALAAFFNVPIVGKDTALRALGRLTNFGF
jgi:hypothetical protein